jgi:hypothetical protein
VAALPSAEELVLDMELVEDLANRLVDDVINALRPMVEAGHGRKYDSAILGRLRE